MVRMGWGGDHAELHCHMHPHLWSLSLFPFYLLHFPGFLFLLSSSGNDAVPKTLLTGISFSRPQAGTRELIVESLG